MKTLRNFLVVLMLVSSAVCIAPHKSSAQVTVSFQLFYDQLSPYGQWINYPGTGYVWIPTAGVGFMPYSSGGHWVLTQFGWTWVSDYPWGWAPFHYGRWNFEPAYGWIWIPGNVWGPAWVVWRKSPGYYGWVPMGHGKDNDKADQHWVFVKDKDIDRPDISRHYISRANNVNIIKNSSVIENSRTDNNRHVSYNAGPDREEIQRIKGRPVTTMEIEDNDKPGQNVSAGRLKIYRPEIQKDDGNEHRPSKVADAKEVKPQPERSGEQDAKPAKSKEKKQPASTAPKKDKKEKKKPNSQ